MNHSLRYLLYTVIFFILSCTQNKKENLEVITVNATLESIINAYIQSLPLNSGDSVLTLSIRSKKDSVILSIANSYPDLNMAKLHALKSFNKYTVCFVGEENPRFYTVTGKVKAPASILKKSADMFAVSNRPPSSDPLQWLFYFKDNSIIGMYPKEEIEKFILYKDLQNIK